MPSPLPPRLKCGEVPLIFDRAIRLDIPGHQSFPVGDVQSLLVPAEHHPVCAHFLASDQANLAFGIDEISSEVIGEIDAALGIANQFAHAPERLVPKLACQDLPLRSEHHQLRRFVTLVGMSAGIRAGPLDANEAALVVDPEGSGAMGILDIDGKIVLRVEPANRAGLLLREIDPAVFGGDQTVGVVRSSPEQLPRCTGRDDSGDFGNRDLLFRRRLREALRPCASLLLSNRDVGGEKS